MKPEEFGRFIKNLRDQAGLTLRQLERSSGVSNSYLSQLENGKKGFPSPDILEKLASPLKVSYTELMDKAGYYTFQHAVGKMPSSAAFVVNQAVVRTVLAQCKKLQLDVRTVLAQAKIDEKMWNDLPDGGTNVMDFDLGKLAKTLGLETAELISTHGIIEDPIITSEEREFLGLIKNMVGNKFFYEFHLEDKETKERYMTVVKSIHELATRRNSTST